MWKYPGIWYPSSEQTLECPDCRGAWPEKVRRRSLYEVSSERYGPVALMTECLGVRTTTCGIATERRVLEARLLKPLIIRGRDGSHLHGGQRIYLGLKRCIDYEHSGRVRTRLLASPWKRLLVFYMKPLSALKRSNSALSTPTYKSTEPFSGFSFRDFDKRNMIMLSLAGTEITKREWRKCHHKSRVQAPVLYIGGR